ncbi:MAG TPA: NAD-binding protein, partial [Polyangiaceae bacterium]|nr:NAD-binding protein [Polyangiaceae bacterium]
LEKLIGVKGIDAAETEPLVLENHVIVVGFGRAGQLAAQTLRACNIPLVVLEMSADNVRRGKQQGLPVYYGDATSEEALKHAHVESARLVVLLINDPQAAQRVVDTIKRVAPGASILTRTRYLVERKGLMDLGAHDVVAEEIEGAVEIIARMLRTVQIPRNVIDQQLRNVRADSQTTERKQTIPRQRWRDVTALDDLKIECALVYEQCAAAGASAVDLRLRSTTGALVVGVRRGERLLDHPDPTAPFEAGDVVYFVGTNESIHRAMPLFSSGSLRPSEDPGSN